jgi:transposase
MNQSHLSEEKKADASQHDNAKPHTSYATSVVIESTRFEIVPHPPYSLHLAPSDFWLFAALKKHLKDKHFTCNEDIQAPTKKWF